MEKSGDRNRDEAQRLLAELLKPVEPPLVSWEDAVAYEEYKQRHREWEEKIELFCWHIIQCAAEMGRGQIRG